MKASDILLYGFDYSSASILEWSLINSDSTIVSNVAVLVDTSQNEVFITLPENPEIDDEVKIVDAKNTFGTNNATIKTTKKINGSDANVVLNKTGTYTTFVYIDDITGWNYSISNIKTLSGIPFDMNSIHDNYVLKYNTGSFTFEQIIPNSVSPILSGPTTGVEETSVTITIDNYDAMATYVVTVDEGSYVRTGNSIEWALPGVNANTPALLTVRIEEAGKTPATTEYNFTITNIPMITDTALLVENSGFDDFIEEGENYSIDNGIVADNDTSWVMTKPELQELGDSDFTKIKNTIRMLPSDTRTVDVSGSTVSSLKVSGVGFTTSDDVLLVNDDNSIVNMNNNINGIVENSGDEITDMGSETVFNSGSTYDTSITKLDDTYVCIAYRDFSNSDYGTTIIGTISGNSITFGSKAVFNTGTTYYVSVIKLDDTHVCIAYKDSSNSGYGTAIIGTISGTSITFGTETVFNSGTTYDISVIKLDDTHVCIAYRDYSNSSYGTVIIGTVNGNSITFGSETVFYSGATYDISITKLDDTHVCIAYEDVSNSSYGTVIIGTISGNSITFGTETVFNSGNTIYISVTKLDDTHVCITYQDTSNSYYGTAIIGTISGNSITFGSKAVFNSGNTYYTSITKLDDTHVCIAYTDGGNSSYGTVIIGTISGNSITFGSKAVFNSGDTNDISVTKLDDTHVCIAYTDGGNSSYGTAIMLERLYDSTLSLTNPLSEVPVKVLDKNLINFAAAIGTETEYIPYEDIELTDLTNVTTTGLTGSSTFDNLWVSDGYHNKVKLTVDGSPVETDVLSVSKSGSGPYTYDITYNTQTNVPTAAFKPAVFDGTYDSYNDIVYNADAIELSYPEFDFHSIDNIRQLKFFTNFTKTGQKWVYLQSDLYKEG